MMWQKEINVEKKDKSMKWVFVIRVAKILRVIWRVQVALIC